ncbi:MAG: Peptide deformylase [Phycisphaerae bacterium]|nr:Peptide deformylase [Phycisphaerae bacterium]
MTVEPEQLGIIDYPHPCLRRAAAPVEQFDAVLARLAGRMFELMRAAKGVGLAAPQVGVSVRMFVMNATGEPGDDLIVVNPRLTDRRGGAESEEGCLSIPEVRVQVRRATRCHLTAQDANGKPFELDGADMICRIWQHEIDHLDGILIIDRMGPTDRIATRRALQELEEKFRRSNGGR